MGSACCDVPALAFFDRLDRAGRGHARAYEKIALGSMPKVVCDRTRYSAADETLACSSDRSGTR